MDNKLIGLIDDILRSGLIKRYRVIGEDEHEPSWFGSKVGKEFVQYLAESSNYHLFNGYLQGLGNHGSMVTPLMLGDWLVTRALQVDSVRAESDLCDYLSADTFEAFSITLIYDLHIDDDFEFCNGVKLVKAESVKNRLLRDSVIVNRYGHTLPVARIYSVLCKSFKAKRNHYRPHSEHDLWYHEKEILESIDDVKQALILARRSYGFYTIAHGLIVEDDVPIIRHGISWCLHPHKLPGLGPSLLAVESEIANSILEKLLKLDTAVKAKIKISIDRLNGYHSRSDMVDRAIDLRVCMESIFLTDGNKEQLRYSLALRAAQFLSNDQVDKMEINKLFKKAYDVTSSAVHNGKMPKKNCDVLEKVAKYAHDAILKIIDEGKVDWGKIELGILPGVC